MDSDYKVIFERLYEGPPNLPYRPWVLPPNFGYEDLRSIREAIDEADGALSASRGRRIRSDAKYFLLLNMIEMVAVPTQLRGQIPIRELQPLLRSDLGVILTEAANLQESREQDSLRAGGPDIDREISGHSVLEAVAASWRNLKLSDLRVWGED